MTTSIDTRSKDQIVGTIAAGMQSRLPGVFLNFAKGKVFRALAESYAGVCLWLQKEIVKILALTRASTSNGDDLDSWYADFDFDRLPARAATGLVVLGRYTVAGTAPLVPVEAIVQTGDGSQRFAVYADTQNGAYSAAAGGYVMAAGAATVNVPVRAVDPGSSGNVGAGAITLLGSAVPGVDTVTNPSAFTDGEDAESDANYRARFPDFINALARGTVPALRYAITRLDQNYRVNILDNADASGTLTPGLVTVFVDDGSGSPSNAVVARALDAVGAYRSAGIRVAVLAASPRTVAIQMIVEVARGYYGPDVIAAVTAALSVYVNGLGLGEKVRYTKLADVAYRATDGVANVVGLTLNGGVADLVSGPGQTPTITALVVNQAT